MPDDKQGAQGERYVPLRRTAAAAVSPVPSLVFLAAVVVFIIYGSLFPFDFVNEGLPVARFFAEYDIFANQSDAIDNFILFVPLGIALHLSFRRNAARLAAAILSVLVLAIGIQLVQLYLPSRTASLSDAFWNTVGLGAGLLVAARVRHVFRAQMSVHAAGRDDFLAALIVLWFVYESYPFVPTLDLGLLRQHVKTVVFAPPFELMRLVQHGLAAALAGIAITRLGLLRRPVLGVIGLGALSIGLEVCVAYGSLRRETLLGIALGLAAGHGVAQRFRPRSHDAAFALALGALLITVLVPFRGQAFDQGFTWTPFSQVLWQGVAKDVPPSAFEALAIGAMLWAGMSSPTRFRDRPYLWSALVVVLLAALEWGRVALEGLHGDTSSIVMAIVLAPAAVALRVGATAETAQLDVPPPDAHALMDSPANSAPLASGARSALIPLACSAAALTVAMWVLLQLPGIPYNLKKLFGDHALAGSAVFSLALLWLGSGPWLVAHTALRLDAHQRRGVPWTPVMVVGIALVSFILVDLATPEIMLNKIIGAPDLYRRVVDDYYWGEAWSAGLAAWPRELVSALERVVRYVALYAVFAIPLVVGLLAIPRRDRRARVIVAILCLLPFWVLAKVVVLDWAITDNLDELVADGGAWFLGALIALFALNVLALVAYRRAARTLLVLAMLTATLAAANWWLLNQGIETVVINNGRVFDGIQFLLGENRTALLSAPALFVRFGALYVAAIAVVVTGVLLAMRVLPVPATAGKPAGTARRTS